jgi:aspartate 1-decarboxylase
MFGRMDPGACPVCGAAHSACTAGDRVIVAVQLPARDEMATVQPTPEVPVVLGDGSNGAPFSTATYRGRKGKG